MTDRAATTRARLAALGRLEDHDFPPAEAALALAALDHPGSAVESYLGYLDQLAAEMRAAAHDRDVNGMAGALFEVICHRHRFRGDDRDDEDLSNSNLMDVIDRRRGNQDALGLLALAVARAAGVSADALAFPGHFLLRIEDGAGRRLILHPFAGGLVITPPEMRALLKAQAGLDAELEPAHYRPLGNRDIVIRLQSEAKFRLLRLGCVERALAVVESTLLMAPDLPLLWREAGMMHMRLDNPKGAVAALEQYMARTTNAQARARTQALLAEIMGRMN